MKIARTGQTILFGMLMMCALGAHAQSEASSSPAPMASSSGATSSKAADRALRRRVLTALGKAKGLQTSGITVRAHDGAVLLEGWVPEQAQIDQVSQIVAAVQGVTSVKNTLTLSTF
ncbi:MAG TPA: BON domain-containing protein [Paraburkholderia sp.]|jgi:osmotically-inducible protein OsmY|uniref:BON domain-containing protein n=1 Tax=Paraburkholderia sp. TaxID=1926495 RepID=UPI002DF157C3|nr:BON domain-containing protein [Paraburkholderia sp.]